MFPLVRIKFWLGEEPLAAIITEQLVVAWNLNRNDTTTPWIKQNPRTDTIFEPSGLQGVKLHLPFFAREKNGRKNLPVYKKMQFCIQKLWIRSQKLRIHKRYKDSDPKNILTNDGFGEAEKYLIQSLPPGSESHKKRILRTIFYHFYS